MRTICEDISGYAWNVVITTEEKKKLNIDSSVSGNNSSQGNNLSGQFFIH